MSGYSAEEVLGRNCRFLQGPDTDRRTILEIRDAIREERACQVTILNYTKQGKPFWNLFHMAPVYSKEDGRVIHFVGVQTPLGAAFAGDRSMSSSSSVAQPVVVAPDRERVCPCTHSRNGEIAPVHSGCTDSAANHAIDVDKDDDFSETKKEADRDWEDRKCEALEADKQKSLDAVQSVLCELKESSRRKGAEVTDRKCSTTAATAAGERVLCSSLMLALTKIQQSFVLVNPYLPDMPIVHASDMFLHLSGYDREYVLGRNCRFLQGPNTDPKAVHEIRACIESENVCTVRILNYRKDKTPFWNLLHIAPIRSAGGKVAFFIGVQLDISFIDNDEYQGNRMTPHMQQLGAVGAVRVAIRSLQGSGLRRIQKEQLDL
uniref:Putative LOV domain-containing protein n=1 Tax=Danaea nodosa TaxID=491836 RepID=A0A126WVW2_9MONI|nr:putative LOV domain-containing protein [Danaea nodosa]